MRIRNLINPQIDAQEKLDENCPTGIPFYTETLESFRINLERKKRRF